MIRSISCLIFLLATLGSCAQRLKAPEGIGKKATKAFEKGMLASKKRKYTEAIKYMDKAIQSEPDFLEAKLVRASSYLEMKDYQSAEKYFQDITQVHDTYPNKLNYTLGLVQWKMNKFGDAAIQFDKYLQGKYLNDVLLAKAEIYARNSKFAYNAISNPVAFEPISLGEGINSTSNEYLPAVTADGSEMIFTRRDGSREYFYVSKFEDGVWQPAEELYDINQFMEGGAHTIAPDGQTIIFTSCHRRDGYGNCDLYYSKKRDGKWAQPANLGEEVNSAAWDSQPSLCNNGNTLYFSSNRLGTLGAKDIWVTNRHPLTNKWSEPKNLGPKINTVKDDKAPFMHFDNHTLFFMSNGRPGMGDFDLYTSKLVDDTWSEVHNLGYPINTKFQEGALSVSLNGKTAYMASDRKYASELMLDNQDNAETDIYSFVLDPLFRPRPATYMSITIVDAKTGKPMSAEISIQHEKTGRELFRDITEDHGKKLLCMSTGANYAIHVEKEGYSFYSERLEMQEIFEMDSPFKWTVKMAKIEDIVKDEIKDKSPVVLKNVFFESGSADLLSQSEGELNILVSLLNNGGNVNVEIRGHTDNVGSVSDNMTLSKKRAEAVKAYLINKGIDSSRVTSNGFGETNPIESNETEEGRRKNRRTEFVLHK